MPRETVKIAAATIAFALLHSALASRGLKRGAARAFGRRNVDGLYRGFFNAQAVISSGLLVSYIVRHPGTELYRVRGPLRAVMHVGQLASLVAMTAASNEIGIGRFSGARSLSDWAAGRPVRPPNEAQGPAPDDEGRLRSRGPFRFTRHPLNALALPVIWLWPRMTTGLLTFNVVSTAYLVIGSLHEERRLRMAYREEYERYRRSGVPFFLPARGARPELRSAERST